jgi:hypothetical protein
MALEETIFEGLKPGREFDPFELGLGQSRLESTLNSAAGVTIGSDLRFQGLVKVLSGFERSLSRAQIVGVLQLFLIKEWMITHSVIHAQTAQMAMENPMDRENEARLQQAAKELSDFLNAVSKSVDSRTISKTQSLFDNLSPATASQLQSALGLDYGKLQEIESRLSALIDFKADPTYKDLLQFYGEDRATIYRSAYSPVGLQAPLFASAAVIGLSLSKLALFGGGIALLTGHGSDLLSAMIPIYGWVFGAIWGTYGVVEAKEFITGKLQDSRNKKSVRTEHERQLLIRYQSQRNEILRQFYLVGQSPYTCGDLLKTVDLR